MIDWVVSHDRRALAPRLTADQRRRFRNQFNYRVQIASQGAEDRRYSSAIRPIVDELDGAIFRTGHAYRNRVYHADHHNEIALPLIARVYTAAVGRAFVRQQPRQSATSLWPGLRDRLDELGYDEQARGAGPFGADCFAKAHAAEFLVAEQLDDLQPTLPEIGRRLSEDLIWRAEWARTMVRDLTKDGFPLERIIWAANWGEKWDAISGDEELVRLETEIARLEAQTTSANDLSARLQAVADLETVRNDRVKELLAEQQETVFDFHEVDRIERAAGRLHNARDAGSLFDRYQQLDEAMERIEHRFDEIAIGWDQFVQDETDRLRGK